jgi:hypothetical protein
MTIHPRPVPGAIFVRRFMQTEVEYLNRRVTIMPPMHPGLARRIGSAMEEVGLNHAEFAELIGTTRENAYDLTSHDDELVEVYTLGEALRIATVLRLPLRELLAPGCHTGRKISFAELATLAGKRIASEDISLAGFENKIGWELLGFLDNPEVATRLPLPCLRDLCRELDVNMVDVLPDR